MQKACTNHQVPQQSPNTQAEPRSTVREERVRKRRGALLKAVRSRGVVPATPRKAQGKVNNGPFPNLDLPNTVGASGPQQTVTPNLTAQDTQGGPESRQNHGQNGHPPPQGEEQPEVQNQQEEGAKTLTKFGDFWVRKMFRGVCVDHRVYGLTDRICQAQYVPTK